MTASEKILQKALVGSGSKMDSSAWSNHVQANLKDRAFFSACVAEQNILDAAQRLSAEYAAGGTDLSKLRLEWRKYLDHSSYEAPEGMANTIKDLYSQSRIDVIIKTNVAQARGFIQYAEGTTPGAFAAFPAQEFTRIRHSRKPRQDWEQRWENAGGKVIGRRMIALKNDAVWGNLGKLGPFGNPFPPFDWGSGMGVLDVDRKTAIELGLITEEEIRARVEKLRKREADKDLPSMNGHLSAKVPYKQSVYQALKSRLGDFVKFDKERGEIIWRQDWAKDFIKDTSKKGFEFDAGAPTEALRKILERDTDPAHVKMLKRGNLRLNDSWINDEDDKHDVEPGHGRKHFGERETTLDTNIPMTNVDLELLPSLWRTPSRAMVSKEVNTTVFLELDLFDGSVLHARIDLSHNPRLKTLFKRKTSYIIEEKAKGLTAGGPPTA